MEIEAGILCWKIYGYRRSCMARPMVSLAYALAVNVLIGSVAAATEKYKLAVIHVYDSVEGKQCVGDETDIGSCVKMGAYSEFYLCNAAGEVLTAHCTPECTKCSMPFTNHYNYVNGECNRDFLKAHCTSEAVPAEVEMIDGYTPKGADDMASLQAGDGVEADSLEEIEPDDGLTAAERRNTQLEDLDEIEEYEKPRAPLLPKEDAKKFFSSKYTDGAVYAEGGAEADTNGGVEVFAREGRRDSLRACAMLVAGLKHARALAAAEAGDAEQPESVEGVTLALKRCEQLRKEQADEGSSPAMGRVEVQADGRQAA